MNTGPTEKKSIFPVPRSASGILAAAALLALMVVGGAVLLVGGNGDRGRAQVSGANGSGLPREGEKRASPSARPLATPSLGLNPAVGGVSATVTTAVVSIDSLPQGVDTPLPPPTLLPADTPAPEPPRPSATSATQVLSIPAPTDLPIPQQPERVGGPVTVPHNHDGPRWVTLQVGHLRSATFPDELAHLRSSTGASAAGLREVEINELVAQRTARYLIERGYNVDILDAVVPVNYTTDFFLSIHADGNDSAAARGFKAVTPWNAVPSTEKFVEIWYEEYGKATGLPTDPVTSVGMANYYAFNPLDYRHAVNPNVPGALIEMGFVTNPTDRRIMTQETDKLAWGITNAIDRWFRSGVAGPVPTPYPSFTPTNTPTPTPSNTPTETPTQTPTLTPTHTPTITTTPIPTAEWDAATATAAVTTPSATQPPTPAPPSTATPTRARLTPTPIPSPTPLQGIVTGDGRWLPPLSPHVRYLPQPGSGGPPVRLDVSDEDFVMTAEGRERIRTWEQFYYPDLGRSIWKRGPDRPIRH